MPPSVCWGGVLQSSATAWTGVPTRIFISCTRYLHTLPLRSSRERRLASSPGGWPALSQSFQNRRVPRPSSAWAGILTSVAGEWPTFWARPNSETCSSPHSLPAAAFFASSSWVISTVPSGNLAVIFSFSAQGSDEILERAHVHIRAALVGASSGAKARISRGPNRRG